MALTVSLANPAATDSCLLVLVENIVGANTWSTSDTGRLCVNSGQWTQSPEASGTFQVLLDDGSANSNTVVELHAFNSNVGNSGPGAVRCGGSFPVSDPSDPVGNYKWTVISV
jgi:hypothetical protein